MLHERESLSLRRELQTRKTITLPASSLAPGANVSDSESRADTYNAATPTGKSPAFLERLGLQTGCTAKEVAEAYHRSATVLHPDQGGTKESFQRLRADYEDAKRYVEQIGHRPRLGWNPAERTVATAEDRSLRGETKILALGVVALASMLLFGAGHFPLPLVAVTTVAFCLLLLILMVIGLPRLPRVGATLSYLAGWFVVTALLVFFYPDAIALMRDPDYTEWAPFIVLIPFAYFTLTVIGGMSWAVSLINKR